MDPPAVVYAVIVIIPPSTTAVGVPVLKAVHLEVSATVPAVPNLSVTVEAARPAAVLLRYIFHVSNVPLLCPLDGADKPVVGSVMLEPVKYVSVPAVKAWVAVVFE